MEIILAKFEEERSVRPRCNHVRRGLRHRPAAGNAGYGPMWHLARPATTGFYGATDASGISSIRLSNSGGVDGTRPRPFGRQGDKLPAPEPGVLLLLLAGGPGLARRRRDIAQER